MSRLRLFSIGLLVAIMALLRPAEIAAAEPIRILAFGDSLISGYGLPEKEGFAHQLQEALTAAGHDAIVINGGVAGDTTAGGLARLDWALGDRPDIAILELGANDALRGLSPKATRENLWLIAEKFRAAGVAVLLSGMKAPRNLGTDYAAIFDPIYPELAAAYGFAFDPFFLEGVAGNLDLNQPDAIHPNAEGIAIIVARLLPLIEGVISAAPPAP